MANIYDTANEIEKDLRESSQYENLKAALATVKADEEANGILEEFQGMQALVYQKQQMGQQVTEEEAENAQAISQKMTENELTTALMDSERELNQVLTDINEIIMKPIQEVYQ